MKAVIKRACGPGNVGLGEREARESGPGDVGIVGGICGAVTCGCSSPVDSIQRFRTLREVRLARLEQARACLAWAARPRTAALILR